MTVPAGVETPEVLVDVDVLSANLARAAASTSARGLGLR